MIKKIFFLVYIFSLVFYLWGCSNLYISLSDEEKLNLKEAIENPLKEISTENTEGEVKIESAYLISLSKPIPEAITNYKKYSSEDHTNDVLIIDEKELFDDAAGDFVYLFFQIRRPTPDLSVSECLSADILKGNLYSTLSLNLKNTGDPNGAYDDIISYYDFVFKIEKSSLSGSIEKLEINIVDSN